MKISVIFDDLNRIYYGGVRFFRKAAEKKSLKKNLEKMRGYDTMKSELLYFSTTKVTSQPAFSHRKESGEKT